MNTRLYPSADRGKADYGWLKANYSFSFGNYYHQDKINFGVLRVLNDDVVSPGMGFGTHPHDNMEIVTIPLEGALRHRDSMGNEGTIGFGEIQVMSAGTGIEHSEVNASRTEFMKTLQIWVVPQKRDVRPRYDQKAFNLEQQRNSFITVVSPEDKTVAGSLWIHQQAFFNPGIFDAGNHVEYDVRITGNGLYVFLIEGEIVCDNQTLYERDAMEITGAGSIRIESRTASKILLIEVPMTIRN